MMPQKPQEKFSPWASVIAINVSVAICQLPIRPFFFNLEKHSLDIIKCDAVL